MGDNSKRIQNWAAFSGKKGPGFCVICGQHGDLTRDHVPPQGCIRISNKILSRLTMEAGSGEGQRNTKLIQGGLKFKTLCGRCNGELLGLRFDPELKHLVDSMNTGIQEVAAIVVLPRIVRVEANLHLVARSVIGHVLASHSVSDTMAWREDIGASEALRHYFLHPECSFPDDWSLYCWPYFSGKQVILKHAGWMDISLANAGEKVIYGHLLKFSPFGFWLVHKRHREFVINALEITPEGEPDASRTPISFDLRHAPHCLYPENPSGHQMIIFANDQSSVAAPVVGGTKALK
jgi:hypothetical protein